ncbi:hypothetical protein [Paraglaciecola chathamensis]|uniref:Uncharacterized protein n=1 Tax=Paraglaciecola agarilytica NO2 TaxID=1125747 RepID=A0ABQ0I212_9ALTE|nr:hypothetical protein [Paraglaciecola agarilytica]GAC03355.1 hypothetical protein GAGA_0490 [Paraglaciecola agarilytica NO2]
MTAKQILTKKISEYSKSIQSESNVNNHLIIMTLDDDIEHINEMSDAGAEALLFSIRAHESKFKIAIEPVHYAAFLPAVTEH